MAAPQFTPRGSDALASGAGSSMPDTQTLADDATAAAEAVKRVVGDVSHEAQTQIDTVLGEAKDRVADVTEQARGMAAQQKDLLADQLGDVARAVTRVADDLAQQSGPAAPYIRMVADNAGKLSETIRDKNVEEIVGLAQDFGRRQPAAFLGAAALLGFAASRFITASAERKPAPAQRSTVSNGSADTTYSASPLAREGM